MKVKIIGLSGSPRKGRNTEYALNKALKGAEEVEDVETELVRLCDKKIGPCIGCLRCHREPQTKENLCQAYNDDFEDVVWKLAEADGIIIGCPVYQGATTPLLECFFSRFECFGSNIEKDPELLMPFRNKVGGAIAVGDVRHGGQEYVLHRIYYFLMMQQMIPVGMMEGFCMRVSSLQGGACIDYSPPGFPESPLTPRGLSKSDAQILGEAYKVPVQFDHVGLETCRLVGRRVALVAKCIKPWADEERKSYQRWFLEYYQDFGEKYRGWHPRKLP
ncbi:MAG: flavodoxin family protein [Candidatus Odinarchaeota archaeon]|nr:flavodoxin family protein [Candidatus Odinarchaeota archaeon]